MKKQAVDFLFVLNASITNIRLYPPSSAIIQNSLERLEKALNEALAVSSSLEFAESEKTLLINGEPLPEKEQQKPQIRSFLSLMLDSNIKSLTFFPGVTRPEISNFLQLMENFSRQAADAGGLAKMMADQAISHIAIDEKVYVQMDSDHQIVSGLDISDEDFVRYLIGEQSVDQKTIDQVREMAGSPGWFAGVFQAGARYLIEAKPEAAKKDIDSMLTRMIDSLEKVSDSDRQQILGFIAAALPDMDEDVKALLDTGKLRELLDKFQPPPDQSAQETVYRSPAEIGRDALTRILKGDRTPLADTRIIELLPKMVSQIMDKNKDDMLEALTQQMKKSLLYDSPEVRKAVAGIMAEIDEKMEAGQLLEKRIALSKKLVEWIRAEETISAEYQSVTGRLENLAQTILTQGNLAGEADHILEAYALIKDGDLSKEEAIQALAANMLQNLSTDHILEMLLQEPRKTSDSGKDDIYSLVILGSTTIERLLDRLRDSHGMSERNRIVQAISRMGRPAAKPVVDRLGQKGPWYYIRNLTLLLGRVGDQSHLSDLEPMLMYPDYRIQLEAVKSIQAIGGEKGGDMLLKHIPAVDPNLVGYIISVLGALKYRPAVPYLVNLVESRSLWQNKAVQDEIRAKACEVLGRMQAQEAVSALEKIVRTKGFFRGYTETVRSAALKALANIKRG